MVLRSSGLEPEEDGAAVVIVSPEFPIDANAAFGHDKWIAAEDSLASNNHAVRFRWNIRDEPRRASASTLIFGQFPRCLRSSIVVLLQVSGRAQAHLKTSGRIEQVPPGIEIAQACNAD
jgi:hypothetical protein